MARKIHKRKKGFTLIEIIVVLVIIGILAAVSIPVYTSLMNNGATQSAENNLQVIYNMQKTYYLNNGSYCINSCNNLANINSNLHLNITDTLYVYTCACSYSSSCPPNPNSVNAYCYAQLASFPQTFLYETAGTPVYGLNTTSPSSGTMSCGSLAGSLGKQAKACNNTPNSCPGYIYRGQTFDCVSCCSN